MENKTATKELARKEKLTTEKLKKLSASDGKRSIVWDTEITGYGVRILPSGSKTLFYQGRLDGELIRVTIGRYPAVNAQAARTKAKAIQGEIAMGRDPRPEKKDDGCGTFGDLMTGYVDLLDMRKKKDARAVRNQVTKDIEKAHPRLWKKTAREITLSDCMKIIKAVADAGKPRQADKLRAYIRTAFSEAIGAKSNPNLPASLTKAEVDFNPARDIKKVDGSSNAKTRALTLSEFRAYWQRVKQLPEPRRSLVMLHVLTGGQRQQQLARVTLYDIDRDAPAIAISDYKGRRKEPRMHIIPLIPEALEAIDRITGSGEFVFSADGGKSPIGISYLNDATKRICKQMAEAEELEKGPFTAGTIRATIETRLAAKPYRVGSDVLAQLLSHGMGGIQAKHYQHHDFFDEKLEALEMLHRMVEGKAEPIAEVYQMRGTA